MTENERIKIVRKDFGLTLVQFGERLGVTNAAISMVENGINSVSDQLRKAICREFCINENWLRTGEGEMKSMTEDEDLRLYIETISSDEESRKALTAFCSLSKEERSDLIKIVKKLTKLAERS